MVYVSRKEHFNAAHKLYNDNWTKQKNEEIFGKCANEYFHGHNFEIIVTVKGTPHPDTGFVVDMKKLGDIMTDKIINAVDHKNINLQVSFMQGKICSCENMVVEFWKILEPEVNSISNGRLYSIKLYETHKNYVEYFGPHNTPYEV
ncbi:MAG: 6-carboxytetrahydropterin synthase [Cytophagales bacterium]|nr:6-carboxytetrahydropterin synthase [Cytophagales bacterium]